MSGLQIRGSGKIYHVLVKKDALLYSLEAIWAENHSSGVMSDPTGHFLTFLRGLEK